MMLTRRMFLMSSLATVAAPHAATAAEPFHIPVYEEHKVEFKYRQQEVKFKTSEPPGTIVVDMRKRFLYFVKPGGKAIRYGIGVGRQGFSWSGAAVIKRKAKWPTWTPPAAMVARDEFAARWANGMPGGPKNPLGARALYLYQGNVDTLYRIHGTFAPSSIGKAVSSGCIRMINADVADLYDRVPTGTRVVVLQGRSPLVAEDDTPRKRRQLFSLFD